MTAIDSEAVLAQFETDARREALHILADRLDAGMEPVEARASLRRWGQRLSARVLHGVDSAVVSSEDRGER